jgi:hypothetical protein
VLGRDCSAVRAGQASGQNPRVALLCLENGDEWLGIRLAVTSLSEVTSSTGARVEEVEVDGLRTFGGKVWTGLRRDSTPVEQRARRLEASCAEEAAAR